MKNLASKLLTVGLVVVLLSSVGGGVAAAWEQVHLVEYFGYTGESVVVGWDTAAGVEWWEVEGWMKERDAVIMQGSTPTAQITFTLPFAGHYVFRVKACNVAEGCSTSAVSDDPAFATVSGQPQGWTVYGHIAPPGPVVVE